MPLFNGRKKTNLKVAVNSDQELELILLRLTQAMRRSLLTQAEISRRSGINRDVLRRIVHGEPITLRTVVLICHAIGRQAVGVIGGKSAGDTLERLCNWCHEPIIREYRNRRSQSFCSESHMRASARALRQIKRGDQRLKELER